MQLFKSKQTGYLASSMLIALLALCMQESLAQPKMYLKPAIESNVETPMQIVNAGDGSKRLFVAERSGIIKVFDAAHAYKEVYLNFSSLVSQSGEGGLLSIAFHPNFEVNGCLFVHFTDKFGNVVVHRYDSSTPGADVMDDLTPLEVISIPHPANNHYGGEIHFGPDGNLYISVGDGGGGNDPANNAQNTQNWLGKLLRITVATSGTDQYVVPADNPYIGTGDNVKPEIYAIGLRNPFRWSFDRSNGDIWIGDVGQGTKEEIDHRTTATLRGANFGWRCYEGDGSNPAYASDPSCIPANNVTPRYSYGRALGASVIGGVVYRGAVSTAMNGYYIGSDYISGIFHVLAPGAATLSPMAGLPNKTNISDYGESEDGEVYVVAMGENVIYRVADELSEPLPVTLVSFTGRRVQEGVALRWETSLEENFHHFDLEYSSNAKQFRSIALVASQNTTGGSMYTFTDPNYAEGIGYYRLRMVDRDESYAYSRIIKVEGGENESSFVSPSIVTDGMMRVSLTQAYSELQLLNSTGSILLSTNISGKSGRFDLPVTTLATGLYIVRLLSNDKKTLQQKIIMAP